MRRAVPGPLVDGRALTAEEFAFIRQSFEATALDSGGIPRQSHDYYYGLITACERDQPDNLGATYRRYLVTEKADPRQAFILAVQFLGYSRSFASPRQS